MGELSDGLGRCIQHWLRLGLLGAPDPRSTPCIGQWWDVQFPLPSRLRFSGVRRWNDATSVDSKIEVPRRPSGCV